MNGWKLATLVICVALASSLTAVAVASDTPTRRQSDASVRSPSLLQAISRDQGGDEAIRGRACGTQVTSATLRCMNRQIRVTQRVLIGLLRCMRTIGVDQYGDSSGAFGYVFDNNDGGGTFFTSALDLTESGASQFLFLRWRC